jgi:hypothetical protein
VRDKEKTRRSFYILTIFSLDLGLGLLVAKMGCRSKVKVGPQPAHSERPKLKLSGRLILDNDVDQQRWAYTPFTQSKQRASLAPNQCSRD